MKVLVACEEPQEIWKDIPGYEGKYQASTLGNVRSVEREIIRSDGKKHRLKSRVLRHSANSGYPHVNLEGKTHKVHSLVALTFLGNRPEKNDVRHKDGNKGNNRVDNLEYGTRSENNLDGYKIRGQVTKLQKLNPQKAEEIRGLIINGMSQRKVAAKYGVSRSTVRAIQHGELYAQQWGGAT